MQRIIVREPTEAQKFDELRAERVVRYAERHLSDATVMYDSAELCLRDARRALARRQFAVARNRALRSLLYSIGIMHRDYYDAVRM